MLAIDLEDTTREEVVKACRGRWPQFKLVPISSAQVSLSVFKALNPDIIILDVDAGFITTSSTVQKIRGFYSVPVIALSYASDVGKTVRILQEGADCFMLKPVHQRELVAHIDSLLKNGSGYFEGCGDGKKPGTTPDEVPGR